jgi:hypothetical protein
LGRNPADRSRRNDRLERIVGKAVTFRGFVENETRALRPIIRNALRPFRPGRRVADPLATGSQAPTKLARIPSTTESCRVERGAPRDAGSTRVTQHDAEYREFGETCQRATRPVRSWPLVKIVLTG